MSLTPHAALLPLIPRPAFLAPSEGGYTLTGSAAIVIDGELAELQETALFLQSCLLPVLGQELAIRVGGEESAEGAFFLSMQPRPSEEEHYRLSVTPAGVALHAGGAPGLFWGVQTLRQLLPPQVEPAAGQNGASLRIPACAVDDFPRYRWRGLMLDVARHFFAAETVLRLIDEAARYKLNRLHLHLSDDQGWRIAIPSRPELAVIGGASGVDAGPGGFYTVDEYRAITAYAASRHVVIVPEIDMPGHTHALLTACPDLNPTGVAPAPYHGTAVGFSSLDTSSEQTYQLLELVIRDLAALTPGPYLHLGGDEAHATGREDYCRFIERVHSMVDRHGKRMIGWEEIARTAIPSSAIAQHWRDSDLSDGCRGRQLIMSPSAHAYLDMKYDAACPLGLDWAGHVEVDKAYCWDPADCLRGVDEAQILGVESLLWSETIRSWADLEYMVFPRLLGHAEIGWSPRDGRSWEEYRARLAAHGERLALRGVNFYRSPLVAWGPAASRVEVVPAPGAPVRQS